MPRGLPDGAIAVAEIGVLQWEERQPEIEHFHGAVGIEHQIGGLDIAMNDARGVSHGQAARCAWRTYVERLRSRQRTLFVYELPEGFAVEVLHDEEIDAVDCAGVERRDDVRRVEPADRFHLAPKTVLTGWRPDQPRRDQLDRDRFFQMHVLRSVNLAHAALSQHFKQ